MKGTTGTMIERRTFIAGLVSALTAPAIVPIRSLMAMPRAPFKLLQPGCGWLTIECSHDGRHWIEFARVSAEQRGGWIKPVDMSHVFRCPGNHLYRVNFEKHTAAAFSGVNGDDVTFSVTAPKPAMHTIECDLGGLPPPIPASKYQVRISN